jgi:type II secretion system protein J
MTNVNRQPAIGRRRPAFGFTLLELLVVIALMGIVSTLGTQVFFAMTDAWTSTRQRTELDAQADQIFKTLRHDFEQIVSPRLAGVSVKGVTREAQDPRFYNQNLGDDELSFAVLQPVGDMESVRCVQARYYLNRSEGATVLTREVKDFGYADKTAVRLPVSQNVLSFYAEYLAADGQWEKTWDRPELPEAVRVSLTLVNPDSLEQVTRKAEFPVRVK